MQKALNARNRCLRIGCVLTGSGLVHNQNKERGQARLPDLRGSPARLFSFDLRGIQNWVVTLMQENLSDRKRKVERENLSGREGGLAPALCFDCERALNQSKRSRFSSIGCVHLMLSAFFNPPPAPAVCSCFLLLPPALVLSPTYPLFAVS